MRSCASLTATASSSPRRAGRGWSCCPSASSEAFRETLRPVDLLLPYAEGGRLAELHDLAGELDRTDTPEGVRVRARVPATVAERYAQYSVNGDG